MSSATLLLFHNIIVQSALVQKTISSVDIVQNHKGWKLEGFQGFQLQWVICTRSQAVSLDGLCNSCKAWGPQRNGAQAAQTA